MLAALSLCQPDVVPDSHSVSADQALSRSTVTAIAQTMTASLYCLAPRRRATVTYAEWTNLSSQKPTVTLDTQQTILLNFRQHMDTNILVAAAVRWHSERIHQHSFHQTWSPAHSPEAPHTTGQYQWSLWSRHDEPSCTVLSDRGSHRFLEECSQSTQKMPAQLPRAACEPGLYPMHTNWCCTTFTLTNVHNIT